MKVVVDNNLPRSIASRLAQAGLAAIHVLDLELGGATDEQVRRRFAEESIVLLTRDEDFWTHRPSQWVIIWIALHNPTLAQLCGPIAHVSIDVIPKLQPGHRVLFAADQVRIFGT